MFFFASGAIYNFLNINGGAQTLPIYAHEMAPMWTVVCLEKRIRKFWYFMSDFCFVTLWQFYLYRGYFLDYTTFTYSEFLFTYGPFMLTFFRNLFKVTSGQQLFTSVQIVEYLRKSLWTKYQSDLSFLLLATYHADKKRE